MAIRAAVDTVLGDGFRAAALFNRLTLFEEVREIRRRAIQAGLKLVDCPIRHLGTEKAQTLYLALENYLRTLFLNGRG